MINSIKNVFVLIKEYINNIVYKKKFIIPFVLSVFVSYFYSISNGIVFVDDPAHELYYGSDSIKLRTLRWAQVLINRIFGTIQYTTSMYKLFGIIFLVLSAFLFGTLLYFFDSNKEKDNKYIVLSCIYISYPLIQEFWEYDDALAIPFGLTLVLFCLIYQVINKTDFKDYLLLGSILSLVMAGYESPIFAYISLVFLILFIEYALNKTKDKGWFIEGLKYALPLVIAFVLKYVIGYAVLAISGLSRIDSYGETTIYWLSDASKAVTQLIFNGFYYGLRGLSYLPIGEFVVCALLFLIFIIVNTKKNKKYLGLGLLYLISLFFMPIMMGAHFPYRTAQTIHLFVAFVVYLIYGCFEDKKIKKLSLKPVLIVIVGVLCIRQCVFMHHYLSLDKLRSDNEFYVAKSIGYKLVNEFDISKPIIFCGHYDMGDYIEDQIYVDADSLGGKIENSLRKSFGYDGEEYNIPFIETNVNSVFNWAINSPWQLAIKNYLSYYGYDIEVNEDLTIEETREYEKMAKSLNMKAYDIKEFDDYILVYLGD